MWWDSFGWKEGWSTQEDGPAGQCVLISTILLLFSTWYLSCPFSTVIRWLGIKWQWQVMHFIQKWKLKKILVLTLRAWSHRNTWNDHDLLTSLYVVVAHTVLKLLGGTMETVSMESQLEALSMVNTQISFFNNVTKWAVVNVTTP